MPGRFLLVSVALMMSVSIPAQKNYMQESKAEKDKRMQWWREARFGMFIHWGLYAVPAGEWKGSTRHAEWIRTTAEIPLAEYDQLVPQFHPASFNAESWVQMAKDAGMKYITITSKHHDGFCLWDSKETDFDIMSTPFKRDVLKELADACRKIGGIRLCFYHSIMDWHHPDYNERRPWEKDRPTGGTDRNRYIRYMKNQLKELITRYGDIGVLWFDGEWEGFWTHQDGVDLYNYVRSLKPDIIINNRVDKGRGGMAGMTTAGYAGDFGTPEQEIPETGWPGVDWESCMTMNDNWGYNKADLHFKSTTDLIRKLVDIASKGGNFLLNIGPRADGSFPSESVERLKAIGDWMKVNGRSIYGSSASPFEHIPWGRVSMKTAGDHTQLFLHVFDWPPDGILKLEGIGNKPRYIYTLAGREAIGFISDGNTITMQLPSQAPDPHCSVIVMEIPGKPVVFRSPVIQTYSTRFINHSEAQIVVPGNEAVFQVRYTMDGQEPGTGSPLYKGPLRITKNCTVKAASFYKGKRVGKLAALSFTKVEPLAALSPGPLLPGLRMAYYQGEWDSLPDFASLRPDTLSTTASISTGPYKGRERYGLLMEGYIRVPQTDLYHFYLSSDDGSRLYIDDQLLVNNDGLHGMVEQKGTVALAAGYHRIRVGYFERTGGDDLALWMETRTGKKRKVPASLLFRSP